MLNWKMATVEEKTSILRLKRYLMQEFVGVLTNYHGTLLVPSGIPIKCILPILSLDLTYNLSVQEWYISSFTHEKDPFSILFMLTTEV